VSGKIDIRGSDHFLIDDFILFACFSVYDINIINYNKVSCLWYYFWTFVTYPIFADAFTSCINRFGRLDIVVNNTAGMQIDLSIDERDEMNDATMRVHYVGINKHKAIIHLKDINIIITNCNFSRPFVRKKRSHCPYLYQQDCSQQRWRYSH